MSITFDVRPRRAELPSFEEVCALATRHLRATIFAEIRAKEPDRVLIANATGPMTWDDEHYAWFRVEGIGGGVDAYFWTGEAGIAHYWHLRCSAGQPETVRLAFGFVAGAIAQLTGGVADSIDGAWDAERLPASGEDLLANYGE